MGVEGTADKGDAKVLAHHPVGSGEPWRVPKLSTKGSGVVGLAADDGSLGSAGDPARAEIRCSLGRRRNWALRVPPPVALLLPRCVTPDKKTLSFSVPQGPPLEVMEKILQIFPAWASSHSIPVLTNRIAFQEGPADTRSPGVNLG